MIRYICLLVVSAILIPAILSGQILLAQPQDVAFPLSWPPSPLTSRQISAVKACNIKHIAKKRYPDSMPAKTLESAFSPVSGCDWAALAFAYATRRNRNETLSDSAKSAFAKAVSTNLGFTLAAPIFYSYFDSTPLVKAPPQTLQTISGLEIEYFWNGLGERQHYVIKIQQANTTPTISVVMPPQFLPGTDKVVDSITRVDQAKIQNLVPTLRNLIPIQSKFRLTACFDNYPSWKVKITYADNTTLALMTDSNFVSVGGPWFTEINQQNYVQFSLAFTTALQELVTSLGIPLGQTAAMTCMEDNNLFHQAFP
jgi:hypothetical protein